MNEALPKWGQVDEFLSTLRPGARYTVSDLAEWAELENVEASEMLADHREAQGKAKTRYITTCQGYGTAAQWRFNRASDWDKHARYTTKDAVQRFVTDLTHEVFPAGSTDPRTRRRIERLAQPLIKQAELFVEAVDALLSE